MAPLACLLRELGHSVRGSDGPLYPPMSDVLAEAGIEVREGYSPANLAPPPDLVIVGNAVPRTNVEAVAARERGLETLSMPQAVSRFLLDRRRPLVVAGTHGKTTTTALAAWVLSRSGRDPGYLIGGVPGNLPRGFRLGSGDRFVIEGDEYNAAWFDRGPKFLHYRPQTAILTSLEYDHADLYPTPEALVDVYRELVALLPDDGLLVAWGDDATVREVAREASCRVVTYGEGPHCEIRPVESPDCRAEGTRFELDDPEAGRVEIDLPAPGRHNLWNALAVWTAARADGIPASDVAAAFAEFRGVRRRLEVVGHRDGHTVIDDFAHHPTAIGLTVGALRQRYPGRPLLVAFEPRSLTAGRRLFLENYVRAFGEADAVVLAPIYHRDRLGDDALDREELAVRLRSVGVEVDVARDVDGALDASLRWARATPDGVMATMSSGSFDGLPRRMLAGLEA